MAKQCGYCVYLDVTREREGKFKCEKNNGFMFANSTEAENCYRYCQRFNRDMYKGDEAVRTSKNYQENHREYTAVGCYITTALVEILGMDDNCNDLNVLRVFRKEYLQKSAKFNELLAIYDGIGSTIARALKRDENSEQMAIDLYKIYIKECVKLIGQGKYDLAVEHYADMTNNLINKYIIRSLIPDTIKENYDIQNGGHGYITLKGSLK